MKKVEVRIDFINLLRLLHAQMSIMHGSDQLHRVDELSRRICIYSNLTSVDKIISESDCVVN